MVWWVEWTANRTADCSYDLTCTWWHVEQKEMTSHREVRPACVSPLVRRSIEEPARDPTRQAASPRVSLRDVAPDIKPSSRDLLREPGRTKGNWSQKCKISSPWIHCACGQGGKHQGHLTSMTQWRRWPNVTTMGTTVQIIKNLNTKYVYPYFKEELKIIIRGSC